MNNLRLQTGIMILWLLAFLAAFRSVTVAQVTVVNMTPTTQSYEVNNDAEPNVAVNPVNTSQIAATAFTPCPTGGSNAPIYVSTDGGANWTLNCIVPGGNSTSGTADITIRFAGFGGMLYAGDMRGDAFAMNILRTADFTAMAPMTVLLARDFDYEDDQPYIQATTGLTSDRVYVGHNEVAAVKSATVTLSLDAATAPTPAGFRPHTVETRTNCGQDGPSIRPALHADGTVYAAFFRWVSGATGCGGGITTISADVVVVRDDNWGSGPTPFSALTDLPNPPGDGLVGKRVAIGVPLRWKADFGSQITLSSQISIAVDPEDSRVVWIAWDDGANADASNYTIHVRRSTNSGATWSGDLKTVVPATNPALAINSNSKVALLYQKFVNPGTCAGGGSCWETHVERTLDGTTWSDLVLANVSAAAHTAIHRDIGDYEHVMASGRDFYGVFSADNTPNMTNFPNSVTYLRYANFATHQLFADAAHTTTVPTSIDPFFFHITEIAPSTLTVKKVVIPGNDPGRFDLVVDGTVQLTGAGNSDAVGPLQLPPGTHTVTENASSGTSGAEYSTVFQGDCAPSGEVTLQPGDNKTCTLVNSHGKGAFLTVTKKFISSTSSTDRFDIFVDGALLLPSAGDGDTTGKIPLSPGSHSVSENLPEDLDCSGSILRAYEGACTSDGSVTLAAGDDKTCTVENTKLKPPTCPRGLVWCPGPGLACGCRKPNDCQ